MYSGSDSTESQKYRQWAMNPSSYQNMANDQVDWAALAQQWIIMKEAGPPPIPGDLPLFLNNKSSNPPKEEGGEAPMEVENDKEDAPNWNVSEPLPPPGAEGWNWNAQNQNWNWNNSWVPPVVPPPPTIGPLKPPLLPTPNNMYTTPPESSSDNAFDGYGNSGSNNDYGSGYWTGSSNTKHIKPHNKRYSKVNVPIRAVGPVPPAPVVIEPVVPTLDSAKRKQLPAWIREGLEKMEKDKLKQLEKEKEKQAMSEYLEKNKQTEKETMEILKSTMRERQKSKFESDGENSDKEVEVRKRVRSSPVRVALTPEELMLKVRRTMTEILLNVTNRHIEAICKEEHQRYTKKYKGIVANRALLVLQINVLQHPAVPTLAQDSFYEPIIPYNRFIGSKPHMNILFQTRVGYDYNIKYTSLRHISHNSAVGLGVYGAGSDSSSEEEDKVSNDSRDSDIELKEIIRRKMTDFQRTEREIEERLDEAERRKGGSVSRSSSPDSNDNDSQVDVKGAGRKHHQEDKPSPRPKNPYEKQKSRSYSSSSEGSDYSNDRSKNSRRSSSSESNDSHKRLKKKRRSRSNSPSPVKKRKSPSETEI
ncbi:hypothetical protein NQ317_019764 [Molorchus minor]|uniref:Arginine/serine-rich protein PNISR n=1 Tax=Molorchus minor TaxID=1323400 RepID=A0ABQ9K417_9CUCU|nr:hypothetical protein NQ317_019764 [Molorchus minor]